jgi:phosphate:Na+ symporter
MTHDSAVRLPDLLRLARYYVALAELAEAQARAPVGGMPVAPWQDFLALARELLRRADPAFGPEPNLADDASLDVLGDRYQALKAALLRAGANGELDMDTMEALLRAASLTRRACEQALKAARLLLRLEAHRPAPEGISEDHAMSDY